MSAQRDTRELQELVESLCRLPSETEWVEFKRNNDFPEEIGQYISALSNSAALLGKPKAYLVWGIDNRSHEIVGTTVSLRSAKVGNEDLEPWLVRLLSPGVDFQIFEFDLQGKRVVLLEIPCAQYRPIQFKGTEYIRVGSYKKTLKDHPQKEAALWRKFDETPFERSIAMEHVSGDKVFDLLDSKAYFRLLNQPYPERATVILSQLEDDGMIARADSGLWCVTNLGVILLARRLAHFDALKRKALRVIRYPGNDRLNAIGEQVGARGYASGFEGIIEYVSGYVPKNEVMGKALRKDVPMYPELAIRELIANAVIHQDLRFRGAGPMVEIFENRIEITNPGIPLVDTAKFVNSPPRSRNEDVAAFMRRAGVCEERGSGIDKVVAQTERYQLPAPLFEVVEGQTRAVLFAHKEFNDMAPQDKLRACYLHACLKHANREYMTNTSLRERFGLDKDKISVVSRIIRDAMNADLVRQPEEGVRKYMPGWA